MFAGAGGAHKCWCDVLGSGGHLKSPSGGTQRLPLQTIRAAFPSYWNEPDQLTGGACLHLRIKVESRRGGNYLFHNGVEISPSARAWIQLRNEYENLYQVAQSGCSSEAGRKERRKKKAGQEVAFRKGGTVQWSAKCLPGKHKDLSQNYRSCKRPVKARPQRWWGTGRWSLGLASQPA